ncbi:MAG: N-acetylmuramoyl-L-alanine amidase [Gemmatimonadaceae bacterium]
MALAKQWKGSPNVTPDRAGYHVEAIVIHIMQGTMADTDSWFGATRSQVSAHYGVARNGDVHQYVHEGDTAWHAGRVSSPSWSLLKPGVNPNLYTVGIEHEGWTGQTWTDQMLLSSATLVAEVATRWAVPLDRAHVIAHSQIFAPKSFCPGAGVSLNDLIARAKQKALQNGSYNTVAEGGSTMAAARVNVRLGAPSTSAPIVRTLDPPMGIQYIGWTSTGESVHNNPHWYKDLQGNFVWAGATTRPLPGL